jgi:Uma2 family endonuclease
VYTTDMAMTNPIDTQETVLPVVIDLPVTLTDEFIAALCARNPQYRFETDADGRLVMTPGTGFLASGGEAELIRQVGNWNTTYDFGFATSSSGYFRQLHDKDVKGPDCTYTAWENIESQIPPDREHVAYAQLAPDVTFELMSPTDDLTILETKCHSYLANGIKVAVLLVSRNNSVRIYRPNSEPVTAPDIRAVVIAPEMPRFVLNANAVFAATRLRRRR